MAFDGFTTANLQYELSRELTGGYISKIIQPEPDELLLTVKAPGGNRRLLLSANPSLPLVHLTESNKTAPMTAPVFCMLLRKHIGGGKILDILQPSLERILVFIIEHRNEMGDLCRKKLILELMGKHSNIIFADENDQILDAIRRVPAHVSSVREVLPGRPWFIPRMKTDPLTASENVFIEAVFSQPQTLSKALYTSLTGFSPAMAEELCSRACIDSSRSAREFSSVGKQHLYHTFSRMMDEVRNREFEPAVFYQNGVPQDFSCLHTERYADNDKKIYSSISALIEGYYAEKESITRIRQKSSDLRRILTTAQERTAKKLHLQEKQLKDTEKLDRYRIYGELLNTYGYECSPGDKSLTAVNYYNNETVTIPLDPTLSAGENAKKYFDRYNKLKRTAAACRELIASTSAELAYLDSIHSSLEIAADEADLAEIRRELMDAGYIRKKTESRKNRSQKKSSPLHYLSSDGFDIFVGKNNFQNDELTFSVADGNDWWFHAKQIPGSHVIVRTRGKELPDRTFEEAASLAAWYSSGRNSEKVEIDYTQKKNVKKPNGSRPGFVIYHTNYSMVVRPCTGSLTVV